MKQELEQAARTELVAAERVLVVNAAPFAHGSVTQVDEIDQGVTPEGGFDGILWRCESDARSGIRALRSRARPGAKLVLLAELRRGPWGVVRDLVKKRRAHRPGFEEMCEAVLLSGLAEPRVAFRSASLLMLSALMPVVNSPLDEIFVATSLS